MPNALDRRRQCGNGPHAPGLGGQQREARSSRRYSTLHCVQSRPQPDAGLVVLGFLGFRVEGQIVGLTPDDTLLIQVRVSYPILSLSPDLLNLLGRR